MMIGVLSAGCYTLEPAGGVTPEVVARVARRLRAARARRVLPRPPVVVPVAALDLVRGGRGAPQEAVRERDRHAAGDYELVGALSSLAAL